MQEYRIHGRGGQGVLTVGQLMAAAFFAAGKHVQTFATYGGERRGAPVISFVRAADSPVHRRCDVEHPDLVLLFEPTFLEDGSGLAGLLPGATLVVNTVQPPSEFTRYGPYRFATVDALRIARENGLNRMVNTAVLGAFCRVSGAVTLAQMEAVVAAQIPQRRDENLGALRAAYGQVRLAGEVSIRA